MKDIDYKEVNRIFTYNPETGIFTRKISISNQVKDTVAGTLSKSTGYIILSICGKKYRANRVACVMHHGKQIPKGMCIDHKNGDKSDNRICNLRVMSAAKNSGIVGANGKKPHGINKIKDMWRARVKINGKQIWGTYRACPLIAHIDYLDMIPGDR